jgi:hypothetical protein
VFRRYGTNTGVLQTIRTLRVLRRPASVHPWVCGRYLLRPLHVVTLRCVSTAPNETRRKLCMWTRDTRYDLRDSSVLQRDELLRRVLRAATTGSTSAWLVMLVDVQRRERPAAVALHV